MGNIGGDLLCSGNRIGGQYAACTNVTVDGDACCSCDSGDCCYNVLVDGTNYNPNSCPSDILSLTCQVVPTSAPTTSPDADSDSGDDDDSGSDDDDDDDDSSDDASFFSAF